MDDSYKGDSAAHTRLRQSLLKEIHSIARQVVVWRKKGASLAERFKALPVVCPPRTWTTVAQSSRACLIVGFHKVTKIAGHDLPQIQFQRGGWGFRRCSTIWQALCQRGGKGLCRPALLMNSWKLDLKRLTVSMHAFESPRSYLYILYCWFITANTGYMFSFKDATWVTFDISIKRKCPDTQRKHSDVWWELRVEPLLLWGENSQLRWFERLIRMHPGRLPLEVFLTCSTGRRRRTRWRDYISYLA